MLNRLGDYDTRGDVVDWGSRQVSEWTIICFVRPVFVIDAIAPRDQGSIALDDLTVQSVTGISQYSKRDGKHDLLGKYLRLGLSKIWDIQWCYMCQLIASSSTSKFSVALGGITGGKPLSPYACIK